MKLNITMNALATFCGVAYAVLQATQIDWTRLESGDPNQIAELIKAIALAIMGFLIKRGNGKTLWNLAAAVVLVAAIAPRAQAQTKATLEQIRPPATITQTTVVMVIGGEFVTATLDANSFSYDPVTKTLRAIAATSPTTEVNDEVVTATGGMPTLTLSRTFAVLYSLAVYRNGLRLRPTLDYTVAGNVITFAQGAAPRQGDVVACDYRFR